MVSFFDIAQLLAGVAIFLLGVNFLEESLRMLAGRRFKLFLKNQTSNKLKAIGGGAVVTAILQSSSVVNLMILSFTGAGIIGLTNALAISMGSNLGTTISNWLVVLVGFEFNIERIFFLIAGLSGISLSFFKPESKAFLFCKLFLGLSLVFVGLAFIKTGMAEAIKDADLSRFREYPSIAFFLLGIIITAIIQSSSATVALTLSALYAEAITLHSGMAIVLGSEIGTTLKLFLASSHGLIVKKQLAYGNFIFNSSMALLMLALLPFAHDLVVSVIGRHNNLLALVFYQSILNIAGIIIFYPLLRPFSSFLEKQFSQREGDDLHIKKVPSTDPDFALEALEKETGIFLEHILYFIADAFDSAKTLPGDFLYKSYREGSLTDKYDFIKHYHGEIHGFYTKAGHSGRFEQLIAASRNGMYAAKNIKDAFADIHQLRDSSNDKMFQFYDEVKGKVMEFCANGMKLMTAKGHPGTGDTVYNLYKEVQQNYSHELEKLYKEGIAMDLSEAEVSTLFNFNREMFTAYKSMLFAYKDYLLNPAEAERFEELPGFIR